MKETPSLQNGRRVGFNEFVFLYLQSFFKKTKFDDLLKFFGEFSVNLRHCWTSVFETDVLTVGSGTDTG